MSDPESNPVSITGIDLVKVLVIACGGAIFLYWWLSIGGPR